jgi:hypothetical protein
VYVRYLFLNSIDGVRCPESHFYNLLRNYKEMNVVSLDKVSIITWLSDMIKVVNICFIKMHTEHMLIKTTAMQLLLELATIF